MKVNPETDPFPASNGVFHLPRVFEAELERIFAQGWQFLCCAKELELDGFLTFPGGATVEVKAAQARLAGKALATTRRGPLVFAHQGSSPPPLEEELGEAAGTVDLIAASAQELLFEFRQEIPGNWKLVVSGAIEDYHLPHVHGQTVNPWRDDAAVPTLLPGGHSFYVTPAKVGRALRGLHGLIAGPPPAEEFLNALIYPNLLLIRLWGLVHVTAFVPLTVDRTLRRTRIYTPRVSLGKRPLRAALAKVLRAGMRRTFEEDRAIVAEAHAGTLAGRDLLRGPAHVEEARVEHFLEETGRRLRYPS